MCKVTGRVWLHGKIGRLPLLALTLVITACGGFGAHRVQQGETLYSISWRYGLDYREVAEWNGLAAPYTIYDGQVLRIAPQGGESEMAEPAEAPQPAPVISAPMPSLPPPAHRIQPQAVSAAASAEIKWQWPTQGNVLQSFSNSDSNRKGIDIGGKAGQTVRAAAAGSVVYAGSGLLNYGKLIILKHNDNYLSAYAYNQILRVREGDAVSAGQPIADMGNKAKGDAMLHFEIRYDGRPVNPLRYLPPLRQ